METLASLIQNLAPEEAPLVQFVVVITERDQPGNNRTAEFITSLSTAIRVAYPKEYADGLIEVVQPPDVWYPSDLAKTLSNFNDSPERMLWRTKQNLDYAYAMIFTRNYFPETEFYLQLEDDVITVPREFDFKTLYSFF